MYLKIKIFKFKIKREKHNNMCRYITYLFIGMHLLICYIIAGHKKKKLHIKILIVFL